MEIRNRLENVEKLCCNACQDFVRLVLKPNWQKKLYLKAKEAVEHNHEYSENYVSAYEKMRQIGEMNYKVEYMDISLLSAVIIYCKDIATTKNKTREAMKLVRIDRNLKAHSNTNEDDEELYQRGIVTLANLRHFVETIDQCEIEIDDLQRKRYVNKYIPQIKTLQSIMDEERIRTVQSVKNRKKLIKKILDSDNQEQAWCDFVPKYFEYETLDNNDINLFMEFVIEAANAGVVPAFALAAEYYYEKEDYDKAEKLLYFLYMDKDNRQCNPKGMMILADIYFRKLGTRKEDGYKVVKMLIADGINIKKSKDGKKYEWVSRSDACKEKCLYAIDLPK